ncbi:BTAD domain-containing putative transcriptional regulator [Streptacidiphilus monticola]
MQPAAPAAPAAATAPVVALLGPVRAWSSGCPLLPGPPRQQALLAMLALHAGQDVSVPELVDGLFGTETYDQDAGGWSADQVHFHAGRVRDLFRGTAEVHSRGDGYLLDLAPTQVDALAFERLVGDAAAFAPADPQYADALLDRAFSLWRATPLLGVPGPFAQWERARLHSLHRAATSLRNRLRQR